MAYTTKSPCNLDDIIKVAWPIDQEGALPQHFLIRITKLNDKIKEIKCVPEMPRSDRTNEIDELGRIKFSPLNEVKAVFYHVYKKGQVQKDGEIQIWFDGVEHAVDVFGNPQKQLMNFVEVEGRVIQIDVGENGQSIGDCYNLRKEDIPKQCRQRNVFLWEGDVYDCFKKDDQNKIYVHCSNTDSFCRCCAQIIKGRALISCPTHGLNHQNSNKGGRALTAVKEH